MASKFNTVPADWQTCPVCQKLIAYTLREKMKLTKRKFYRLASSSLHQNFNIVIHKNILKLHKMKILEWPHVPQEHWISDSHEDSRASLSGQLLAKYPVLRTPIAVADLPDDDDDDDDEDMPDSKESKTPQSSAKKKVRLRF